MIAVDRTASESVQHQIAEQFRFLIARGRFPVGDVLPSTRILGRDLGVSFHTVRKAYQQLESEGLVQAVSGRGFVVLPVKPGTDSDQMERAAELVRATIQRLVALGLDDSDIDYTFTEQLAELTGDREPQTALYVGASAEETQAIVGQLSSFRLGGIRGTTIADLAGHEDADVAVCSFHLARDVRGILHRAEVVGVDTTLNGEALDLASRMLAHETLTLVTRYPDAIAPLTRELRLRTGFPGQLVAGSVHAGGEHIGQLVASADAVLYTPATKTATASHLKDKPAAVVRPVLPMHALQSIRQAMPDDQ